MKLFLMTLVLFAASAQAAVMDSCTFKMVIDETETIEGDLRIVVGVVGSEATAILTQNGQTRVVSNDIERATYRKSEMNKLMNETAFATVLENLKLDLKKMKSVSVTFVDRKSNEDDMAGMTIFTVLDKKGRVISKSAQIGWGIMACQL